MKCEICKRKGISQNDIRMGVCWDCAQAESIIADGLDMYDTGPSGGNTPAETAMEKLLFLISLGWRK